MKRDTWEFEYDEFTITVNDLGGIDKIEIYVTNLDNPWLQIDTHRISASIMSSIEFEITAQRLETYREGQITEIDGDCDNYSHKFNRER